MKGTVTFKDDLTINQITESIGKFRQLISKWNELVIDITDIQRIDVAAVQMLIAAQKECRDKGKKLVIRMSDATSHMLFLNGIEL